MEMTVETEPELERPKLANDPADAARLGAWLGAAVGLGLPLVDLVFAFRGDGRPLGGAEFYELVAASVALTAPLLALAAVGGALGLWALRRLARFVMRATLGLPLATVALALLAYGAAGRLETLPRVFFRLALWTLAVGGLLYCLAQLWRTIAAKAWPRGARRYLSAAAFAVWLVALVWVFAAANWRELPKQIPAGSGAQPNVLLVVLDTVRADHLSCYGYQRKTSPRLDEFAADARRYSNVLSPASWTLPSHASLFTGLPVGAHGCHWLHPLLDERFETLAEQLREAGYQTAGLSSNGHLTASRGFAQGFDKYWTPWTHGTLTERLVRHVLRLPLTRPYAADMHRELGRWLRRERDPERPFFVFLNYIEPHLPYAPPVDDLRWTADAAHRKWLKRDQERTTFYYMLAGEAALPPEELLELESLYDEEIAYVDGKVGELLDFLRANGLYDSTLIAVTADHGEHFGEHGLMNHHYSLYEPLVRVPLIVRRPGRLAPGVDDGLVQSHDLFPTILECAGAPWEPQPAHHCRSLLAGAPDEPRVAYAEYLAPFLDFPARSAQVYPAVDHTRFLRTARVAQTGRRKYIRWSDGKKEVYDLSRDPLERDDVLGREPVWAEVFEQTLDEWRASFKPYVAPPVTPERLRRLPASDLDALRGLGYAR